MDKVKIVAIAAVLIVVVAAVAIVMTNDGGDENQVDLDAELRVYGNANGDHTIDQKDLDLIDQIIKGEKDAKDYPLANADYKGGVDEADRALVQKIVNREPCTVYHVNTCTTGDYVVDTKWPVKSAIATGSSNMLMLMTMAGMDDKVHGITYSKSSAPDPSLFPEFSKMESIGGSSTKLPIDKATTYIDKYGCTAVISERTASTVDKDTIEVEYEKMGIDVIRVNPSLVEPHAFTAELLLLGFLFQTEDSCVDIAQWWIDFQADIDKKLEQVDKKVKVITTNGNESKGRIWISAGSSNYLEVMEAAGGEYALGDEVLTEYSSGCYFYRNDTWLYEYDIDVIVSLKTADWYSGTVKTDEKFDASLGIFEKTEAYKNGKAVMVTGDAPIPIRVAYTAVALYPDLFTEDWADQANKEFMDKFMPNSDIDWSKDLFFMITQDMLA